MKEKYIVTNVPVDALVKYAEDPLFWWGHTHVERKHIKRFLKGRPRLVGWDKINRAGNDRVKERALHAEYIAYFVRKGWREPIEVGVGGTLKKPALNIFDGHHRLAAAVYRRDKFIKAEINDTLISRIIFEVK